jgi:predicted nucleic acid-binding protein
VKPLYLLDTGWIVRHLRGVQAYTATLLKIGAPQLALSILSLGELYEGFSRARDPAAGGACGDDEAAKYAARSIGQGC